MNNDQLRKIQSPLKEKYKSDPGSAVVTLKAKSVLGENISCKVDTGKAIVEAGLHPATGGDGHYACSGDMLLEALAACAGVTMNAVATAIDINLNHAEVHAEGDLDFRGTLGVSKEAPVGFKSIKLNFVLQTDADQEQINTLLKLTERYCVVYQSIRNAPPLQIGYSVK